MEELKTDKVIMTIEDITDKELSSSVIGTCETRKELSSNDVVYIPEAYKYEVAYHLGIDSEDEVKVCDLASISKMTLVVLDDSDLDWLKYCDNLTTLDLVLSIVPNSLKKIGCLSNLKYLSIFAQKNTEMLTRENFNFIRNCYNLISLALYNVEIEKAFLSSFNMIEDLIISAEDDSRFEYESLKNIKNLVVINSNPYDIAVSLSNEDIKTLGNNSINLALANESIFEEIININNKLDIMVSELEIKDSDTPQEKLNKIIVYVLEKLRYDKDAAKILSCDENNEELVHKYNKISSLYGSLEAEKCLSRSYASLITALINRTGLRNYSIISEECDWNLVKVENEFYYVDSNYLNSEVRTVQNVVTSDEEHESSAITFEVINTSDLEKKNSTSKIHTSIEINPAITTFNEQSKQEEFDKIEFKVDDITNKKYNLKVGKKRYIVCGGILIGMLNGLGVASGITQNQNQIKRMKEEYNILNFDYTNKNNYSVLRLDK